MLNRLLGKMRWLIAFVVVCVRDDVCTAFVCVAVHSIVMPLPYVWCYIAYYMPYIILQQQLNFPWIFIYLFCLMSTHLPLFPHGSMNSVNWYINHYILPKLNIAQHENYVIVKTENKVSCNFSELCVIS